MGEGDKDITQLTLDFEGLSLRISSTRRVTPKVSAPNPRTSTSSPSGYSQHPVSEEPSGSAPLNSSAAAACHPEAVSGEPGLGPALNPLPSPPQPSSSSSAPAPRSARAQLAATFPSVPARWTSTASSLRSRVLPAEERIRRAWVAGCWDKCLLEGLISSPEPLPAIALPSRAFAVARSANGSPPELYTNKHDFSIAIRPGYRQPVFQSFPSELECRVYLDACDIQNYLPSL